MQKNKLWIGFLFSLLCLLSFSVYANTIAALFRPANSPIAGNPNGKVTIVEFFDYQCSHCNSMNPVVDAIIRANPDVRVIYRDFPIRGPMSNLAARAALAAYKQNKYPAFSKELHKLPQPLTESAIYDAAKKVGLDVPRLKKDMNNPTFDKQIKTNYKLAMDLKLPGTPAFYIGKSNATSTDQVKYVLGEMNQLQMQQAINEVRK